MLSGMSEASPLFGAPISVGSISVRKAWTIAAAIGLALILSAALWMVGVLLVRAFV